MPDPGLHHYRPEDALRLFYAVLVPAELQVPLAALQQRLRRGGGRVAWVAPANLHFTLKFLGEVPARMLPELKQVGREVGKHCAPVVAKLWGVGAFPNTSRPRVIWVGAEETASTLTRLALTLRQTMERNALVLGDDKPFASHCTIGRVKDPAGGGLTRALAAEAEFVAGTLVAGEFHLMLSELSRSGPTYTKLATFPLQHGGSRADEHSGQPGGAERGN